MSSPRDTPTVTRGQGGAAAGSGAYVLVMEGDSVKRHALPDEGVITLGRAPDVELQLDDSAASRRHAQITAAPRHGLSISDLGSHNGTYVNGERLSRRRALAAGDRVLIGDAVLVIYAGQTRSPRALLDAAAVRRRLEEEIERASDDQRSLGAMCLTPPRAGWNRAEVLRILDDELRRIDVVGQLGDSQLLVILPELDPPALAALGERLARALAGAGACVGLASWPGDGADAEVLAAGARMAAARAEPGVPRDAVGASVRHQLVDRTLVVADGAMLDVYELIRRIARSELSVLIAGETGAGKELAAQAVHTWSARARGPFVALNCAAMQETLVESELFGHERGAFSGAVAAKIGLLEAASGGTVFLDEVGELSVAVQAKLLRALEAKRVTPVGGLRERPVDVRIIAATNRALDEDVASGRFRRDLLYRLNGASVILPPLRQRPREIAILAATFLGAKQTLSPATLLALARYPWPGNVRELKNVVEYAAMLAGDETVVEPWHLPEKVTAPADDEGPEQRPAPPALRFRPIGEELRDLEKRRMEEALEAAGGVQKRAAELLRMPLRTFVTRLKQYGL